MQKLVIAITGASGSIYARKLLSTLLTLKEQWTEIAVIMTNNAKEVWQTELKDDSYSNYPYRFYDRMDFHAPFASGSAKFETMIIVPCSMGTIGRIASGISNDLITRAADVILKERRKLICVVRDTPYQLIHLRNMTAITEAGGIICPASPSFYSNPKNFDELASTVTDRVIQLAGLDFPSYEWGKD